jgi:hypothetical protein
MSRATRCNFCVLKSLQKIAEAHGNVVTLIKADDGMTEAFVHKKDLDITKLPKKSRERHFAAFFVELSDECVC